MTLVHLVGFTIERHFVSSWCQVGGLNVKGVLMFVAILLVPINHEYWGSNEMTNMLKH